MRTDEKIRLGKLHVVVLSVEGRYLKMIPRNIVKVKSRHNGFERFYATIDGKRCEVFQNDSKITGAAFMLRTSIERKTVYGE